MKTKISPLRNFATGADFKLALEFVLDIEGYMSNDPTDNGGLTKYGISQAAYPDLDIKNLSFERACEIYWNDYWHRAKCNELPPHVAMALFGASVNHGVTGAIKLLQLAADVKDDGIIGPVTIKAIKNHRHKVLNKFLARRAAKYARICMNDSSQKKYLYGWNVRLFKLHQFIVSQSNLEYEI